MAVVSTTKPNQLNPAALWGFIVLIGGIITRVLIILLYSPVSYSDTPSYRRLAGTVLQGFTNYDGTRTPGYPVFLALIGPDQRVWLVQLLLGFITTLLLFYIGWKLTDRPWFGGFIGLAHTLNLGQLFFESNLLTETLTTFLLILSMAGVLIWLQQAKYRTIWLAFFIGLTSTMTLLVRPLFIYLPFYALIFFGILSLSNKTAKGALRSESEQKPGGHRFWAQAIAFLVPVIALLGGWLTFIHTHYGDWSLTTMTGYHLIQHTGNFFEYVPDEYAAVRDTYIQYRDAQIAKYGTQTNAIWGAIPAMSEASGYNFYDLSRVLAKISIQLILKHPMLYLKSVLNGWWMFWRTPVYWSADALRFSWLAGGLKVIIFFQRGILFLTNLIFIFASLYFVINAVLSALRHKTATIRFTQPTQGAYFWFLMVTIWMASILQTLLDHGDNPRFLVPMQTLVVLWVALFFFLIVQNRLSPVHPSPHAG